MPSNGDKWHMTKQGQSDERQETNDTLEMQGTSDKWQNNREVIWFIKEDAGKGAMVDEDVRYEKGTSVQWHVAS